MAKSFVCWFFLFQFSRRKGIIGCQVGNVGPSSVSTQSNIVIDMLVDGPPAFDNDQWARHIIEAKLDKISISSWHAQRVRSLYLLHFHQVVDATMRDHHLHHPKKLGSDNHQAGELGSSPCNQYARRISRVSPHFSRRGLVIKANPYQRRGCFIEGFRWAAVVDIPVKSTLHRKLYYLRWGHCIIGCQVWNIRSSGVRSNRFHIANWCVCKPSKYPSRRSKSLQCRWSYG